MTPQQFIAKWGPGGPAFDLNERQGAQPHFMDLCQLLGETRGYADVFKRNHFASSVQAPSLCLVQ